MTFWDWGFVVGAVCGGIAALGSVGMLGWTVLDELRRRKGTSHRGV